MYSEYIVSQADDNNQQQIVLRGTMTKPGLHETVPLKLPNGDYRLRVPSFGDMQNMDYHSWSLFSDKGDKRVDGDVYDTLTFKISDCKLKEYSLSSAPKVVGAQALRGDADGVILSLDALVEKQLLNPTSLMSTTEKYVAAQEASAGNASSSSLDAGGTTSLVFVVSLAVGVALGKFNFAKSNKTSQPQQSASYEAVSSEASSHEMHPVIREKSVADGIKSAADGIKF